MLLLTAALAMALTGCGGGGGGGNANTGAGGSNNNSGAGGGTTTGAPTLASLNPAVGAMSGGTTVVVNGTGLDGVQFVLVGNALATGVTPLSANELRFVTPSSSVAGATSITLNALTRGRTVAANAFTYLAAPAVSAVSPANGPQSGGTQITITGSQFENVTGVTVGTAAATSVEAISDTQVRCLTPAASAAGPVAVTVTSSSRGTGTGTNLFTYNPVPVVSTVTPSSGLVTGGASITITGSNYAAGMTVSIGGVRATAVNVASSTQLTCITPAGTAGAANVSATVPNLGTGTLSGGFTYLPLATVSSVSPLIGRNGGGTQLSIVGTNLAGATVTVGGVPCTGVVVVSSTQVTAITPRNTGGAPPRAVPIVVNTASNGSVTFGSSFTYQPDMNISSLSPGAGPSAGLNTVTVLGSNFVGSPVPTVMFGTRAATSVLLGSSTHVTCTAPAAVAPSTTVSVTLVHPDRGCNAVNYSYTGLPAGVLSPLSGPQTGGTDCTITGANFGGTVNVTVGANAAIGVGGGGATVSFTTPPGPQGPATVVVSSSLNGTLTLSGAAGFTYNPRPTVTSCTPATGTNTGGTDITIVGTGFAPSMNVTLGTFPATVLSVTAPTTVTCRTGNSGGVNGPQSVLVQSSTHGPSLPGGVVYTYRDPCTITNLVPGTSVYDGGIACAIGGTNFDASPTPTVLFGGTAATVTGVTAPTTINCIVPARAPPLAGVTITVSSTTMGQSSGSPTFTYTGPIITQVVPATGPDSGGTVIQIGGRGLGATQAVTVTIGGSLCTGLSYTGSTTITCTTPPGTAGPPQTLQVDTLSFGSVTSAFTYYPSATITDLTPNSGVFTGGTSVTITGTSFQATPLPTVKFGGANATGVTVTGTTTITCVSPAQTAPGTMSVTVSSSSMGISNALPFTYTGPQLFSINPTSGPASGGTVVLLTGEGFSGVPANGVTIGGNPCTGLIQNGTTRITATAPAGIVGARDVVVNTSGAGSTPPLVGGFTYYPSVSLDTIQPDTFAYTGGQTVVIGGQNITGSPTPTVLIDSLPATVTSVTVPTTITAIVPRTTRTQLPATVAVTVTSPTMGTATTNVTYTPPVLTAITPPAGPIIGGTPVTVSGDGFATGTSVLVDGRPLDFLAVVNGTTITGNVTAGTQLGTVPVQANVPGFSFPITNTAVTYTYNPAFSTATTLVVGSGPEDVAVADLSGDGLPDIAVCNLTGGSVSVVKNMSTVSGAAFSLAPAPSGTQFAAGGSPKSIAIGDMDRDGWLDVVVASPTSGFMTILRNAMPFNGGSMTPDAYMFGAITFGSGLGPTNDPTLRQPVSFAVGAGLRAIAIADYNLDGAPDVAGTNVTGNQVYTVTNATVPRGALPDTTLAFNAPGVMASAGVAPIAIAAADINNDGKPDIVVVNRDSSTDQLAVFVNTSAPGGPAATFNAAQTFTVNNSPTSVRVGDINGDGIADIICGCGTVAGSTQISTLVNKTVPGTLSVSFSALGAPGSRSVTVGERPIGTALVDMNADGRPDIVSVADVMQAFSFRLNLTTPAAAMDADPAFGNNSEISLGVGPTALAVADLNGDGTKDLVTVQQGSNTVSIFRNLTRLGTIPATFTENPTRTVVSAGPVSLDVADLNGDGMPDIAVTAAAAARLSTFTNSTTPGNLGITFNATANFATGPTAGGLALKDADLDGRPDALVGSFDPGVEQFRLFQNTTPFGGTTAAFGSVITNTGSGGTPRNTVVVDLNHDGLQDLAIADPAGGGVLIYRNTGPIATFVFAGLRPVSPGPVAGLAARDMNGDGKPEIIATDENADSVKVFENVSNPGGAISFGYSPPPGFVGRANPEQVTTGRRPVAVSTEDVNGDGQPDLIVANRDDGSASVILNETVGVTLTFGARTDVAAGAATSGVAVADVSRDGLPDVIVSNAGAASATVLLNQTAALAITATFPGVNGSTKTTIATGNGPVDVKVRDMNGDGLLDIVVPNNVDGTVSVLRNTTP